MLRMIAPLLAVCVFAVPLAAQTKNDQWPHWRGPLATGVAPTADPPIHWDAKTNIKWKAELPGRGDGCVLPDAVIRYIADKVRSNVRELEGALLRVIALATITDSPVTLAIAEQALEEHASKTEPMITLCESHAISPIRTASGWLGASCTAAEPACIVSPLQNRAIVRRRPRQQDVAARARPSPSAPQPARSAG